MRLSASPEKTQSLPTIERLPEEDTTSLPTIERVSEQEKTFPLMTKSALSVIKNVLPIKSLGSTIEGVFEDDEISLSNDESKVIRTTVKLRDDGRHNKSIEYIEESVRLSARETDRSSIGGPSRPRAFSVRAYAIHACLRTPEEHVSMNQSLLQTANTHVDQHASTQEGGLHVPTTAEVLAEYWNVLAEKLEYEGIMTRTNAKNLFRPHLRYVRKRTISLKRMNNILFREQVCLNMGEIHVAKHHMAQGPNTGAAPEVTAEATAEAIEETIEGKTFQLPQLGQNNKFDRKAQQEAQRAQKKAMADKFKRTAKPTSSTHPGPRTNRKKEQNSELVFA